MSDKNTEREHFVPRVYLKSWRVDNCKKDFVWRYDLNNPERNVTVPIDSIAYKKNLYEYYKDGEVVGANLNEKCFKKFEDVFSVHRIRLVESYKNRTKLSQDELNWWMCWVVLQLVRTNNIITIAKEIGNDFGITNDNCVLQSLLPFSLGLDEQGNESFFYYLVKKMSNLSMGIGMVSGEKELITSDNPVVLGCDEKSNVVCVIYPLSPQMCIVFDKKFEYEPYFEIDDDLYSKITHLEIDNAINELYSYQRLSKAFVKRYRNIS